MTSTTIRVGDTTIEYVADGAGDPVLLTPSAGLHLSCFADLARRVADAGFRAIAINLRGVGRSTGPMPGLTLHSLAADLAGLIENVAGAPAHVLGHGFGNQVVRCLATDRPDLVRTLVLLAGVGLVDPTPQVVTRLRTWFHEDATDSECLDVMRFELADPSMAERVFRALERWPAAAIAHVQAGRSTPVTEWSRAAGAAPCLVVQGVEDRVAPMSHGRALRDELGPRVDIADISRAGHMVFLEQPEAVAAAVIAFLRRHTR